MKDRQDRPRRPVVKSGPRLPMPQSLSSTEVARFLDPPPPPPPAQPAPRYVRAVRPAYLAWQLLGARLILPGA